MLNRLQNIVAKIQTASFKNKIFIFLCLLAFSGFWVLLRNPVYQDTSVVVFPATDDIGDGHIYYAVKNGYNKSLSWGISNDAYYLHKTITNVDSLTVENLDGLIKTEVISIVEGIHYYQLLGDKLIILENIIELPRKDIKLLIVKNGSMVEIYLSSLEFFYRKQLINYDVAATFPFYVAYTVNWNNYAFDKSQIDTKLFDVSYERQQDFADNYLDLSLPHYRAMNFKRAIELPFGHSNLLLIMSIISAFALAVFLFFVPFNLLKVFLAGETNRKLFIGLGVYLIGMWLVFRHSGYFRFDGTLKFVVDLLYSIKDLLPDHPYSGTTLFGHLYLISEYIFYLIGYSSRVFLMFFLLCVTVWNYNKILECFLNSNILLKITKYLLIIFILLSVESIAFSYVVHRSYISVTWMILGYIIFFRSKMLENKTMFFASLVCILISVAYRMDFVILFLPVLIYEWLKKITVKKTFLIAFCGIAILCFALLTGRGSNTGLHRVIMSDQHRISYLVAMHKNELNDEEKQLVEKIYLTNLDKIGGGIYNVEFFGFDFKTNENDIKNFRKLELKLILRHPIDFFDHIVSDNKIMFDERNRWFGSSVYSNFTILSEASNIYAELPYKNIFKLGEQYLSKNPILTTTIAPCIISFILVCLLLYPRLKIMGSIALGLFIYRVYLAIMAAYPSRFYMAIYILWFNFFFGLFIAEVIHSGKIKRKWVVPANIVIILVFLVFAKSSIIVEPMTPPAFNETANKWERSVTIHYPYYYRIFGKSIVITSNGGASREPMQYRIETITRNKKSVSKEEYSVVPANRQVLTSAKVSGNTHKAKITFETTDNDVWFDVYPRINIRKHIYATLLLLFLYVNICFLKEKRWDREKNIYLNIKQKFIFLFSNLKRKALSEK
jgi:hypothetical protein